MRRNQQSRSRTGTLPVTDTHGSRQRRATGASTCLIGLCGLLAQSVQADSSAKTGEHIARLVCSACHVVASDQEFPPILVKPAPGFKDLANRPGTTAQTLQHFILNTHWDVGTIPMTMPNPMLTHEQAEAVSRYVLSLRSH